jgi:hypothetical protein
VPSAPMPAAAAPLPPAVPAPSVAPPSPPGPVAATAPLGPVSHAAGTSANPTVHTAPADNPQELPVLSFLSPHPKANGTPAAADDKAGHEAAKVSDADAGPDQPAAGLSKKKRRKHKPAAQDASGNAADAAPDKPSTPAAAEPGLMLLEHDRTDLDRLEKARDERRQREQQEHEQQEQEARRQPAPPSPKPQQVFAPAYQPDRDREAEQPAANKPQIPQVRPEERPAAPDPKPPLLPKPKLASDGSGVPMADTTKQLKKELKASSGPQPKASEPVANQGPRLVTPRLDTTFPPPKPRISKLEADLEHGDTIYIDQDGNMKDLKELQEEANRKHD